MEGYFTFQWGRVCFSDGGASFLSGGMPYEGNIGFDRGFFTCINILYKFYIILKRLDIV